MTLASSMWAGSRARAGDPGHSGPSDRTGPFPGSLTLARPVLEPSHPRDPCVSPECSGHHCPGLQTGQPPPAALCRGDGAKDQPGAASSVYWLSRRTTSYSRRRPRRAASATKKSPRGELCPTQPGPQVRSLDGTLTGTWSRWARPMARSAVLAAAIRLGLRHRVAGRWMRGRGLRASAGSWVAGLHLQPLAQEEGILPGLSAKEELQHGAGVLGTTGPQDGGPVVHAHLRAQGGTGCRPGEPREAGGASVVGTVGADARLPPATAGGRADQGWEGGGEHGQGLGLWSPCSLAAAGWCRPSPAAQVLSPPHPLTLGLSTPSCLKRVWNISMENTSLHR